MKMTTKEPKELNFDEDEDQLEEKTRRGEWKSSNLNNSYKSSFLEVKKMRYREKLFYLAVELEEKEDGIEIGVCVNPEWDSSHAYKSAKTYGSIGPKDVCHSEEG